MRASEQRLVEQLRGLPDESQELRWLSGCLVTAVDTATSPHTVTLRLPDGASVSGVALLGWWTPAVDARVEVLARGPALLALGPVAPTTTSAPPPPPPAPPTRRTATVSVQSLATYTNDGGYWKSELIQGGALRKRGFVFYGDAVASARGTGTIVAGSVWAQRASSAHGVSGEANVRLGRHSHATQPASGADALSDVAVQETLAHGKGKAVPLSSAQIAALNAGAKGLGFEPGVASYSSADYIVYDVAASGALSLTIDDA